VADLWNVGVRYGPLDQRLLHTSSVAIEHGSLSD